MRICAYNFTICKKFLVRKSGVNHSKQADCMEIIYGAILLLKYCGNKFILQGLVYGTKQIGTQPPNIQ